MIRQTFSTLPMFKPMTFRPGLNIVLADMSPGSTDRQTRNGAGKTSLVELVHFLMGGNCDSDSLFRSSELIDYSFGLEFAFGGRRATIQRSGSRPAKLLVDGDFETWPIQPAVDRKTGDALISNTKWKAVLGSLYFDLPVDRDECPKYGPAFRSLLSYFARRYGAGGFQEPPVTQWNSRPGTSRSRSPF